MKREPVVERDAAIGGGHQHQGQCDHTEVSLANDGENLMIVDILERMGQREYRARSNGNAYDGAANAFQPGAAAKLVFQEFQAQGADPIVV
jgi:hypothetical protein